MLRKGRDGAFDLAGVGHIDWAQLHAEGWRHGLDCAELAGSTCYGRIAKDCHPRNTRRDLLDQLQPLAAQGIFEGDKPVTLPPGRAWLST